MGWHAAFTSVGPRLLLGLVWLAAPEARALGRTCGPPPARSVEALALSPEPEVRWGPGFALVRGAGSLAEAGCAPPGIASAALAGAVRRVESSLEIDAEIAVVLTTGATRCDSIYYLPLANDILGIGYAQADPREIFDDTPDLALEGIAFLNDWPYWRPRPEEFQSAFNHEVAHRWGARVRGGGEAGQELLGRAGDHWSYFLDTGGSPHEGNVWVAEASGHRSQTPEYAVEFSELDLYLMGLAPPEDVPPQRVLRAAEAPGLDCLLRPVSSASPPQTCEDKVVRADVEHVGIEAIVLAEGPRVPAGDIEPREVELVVLVIESAGAPLSPDDCRQLSLALEQRRRGFERAARGRMRLVNVLDAGLSCDALGVESEVRLAAAGAGEGAGWCGLGSLSGADVGGGWVIWGALVGGWVYRRARCRVVVGAGASGIFFARAERRERWYIRRHRATAAGRRPPGARGRRASGA